jgi:molybdopterin synthase catalytic subunit
MITSKPLDREIFEKSLENSSAGAVVVFEGRVRNHNEGRKVSALEYEAYQILAKSEGAKILAEARIRFEILSIKARHRVGRLEIGEIAVLVGVSSAHRSAAFDACRYVIDNLKIRLPIWKKEHYQGDTQPVWVNCEACSHPHSPPNH